MSSKLFEKINQITTDLFDYGRSAGVELEDEICNLLSMHFPEAYEKAVKDAGVWDDGHTQVLPGEIVGYIDEGSKDEKECLKSLDDWSKKLKEKG